MGPRDECGAAVRAGHKSELVRRLVSCCNALVSRVGLVRHVIFTASLAVGIGVGNAGRADVGASPLVLTWEAPAGCPTVDEVAGEVERTLAKSGTPAAPFTAAAYVVGGPGQTWEGRLVLNLHGAETERRFAAESCEALASAAALIIAVALDEASDGQAPALAVTRLPRQTPAQGASLFLGANAVIDYNTLPSPLAAGVEVDFGRTSTAGGWIAMGVVGATVIPNLAPAVTPIGSVAGEFWLFGLSGRGCLGRAVGEIDLVPCLGGELVAMRASDGGLNPVAVITDTHVWFSFLGSLAASYHAGRSLDVTVRAEVVIPTVHPRFQLLGNSYPAYEVPEGAFRTALGLAYRFQ
jgi:hypothetical protein